MPPIRRIKRREFRTPQELREFLICEEYAPLDSIGFGFRKWQSETAKLLSEKDVQFIIDHHPTVRGVAEWVCGTYLALGRASPKFIRHNRQWIFNNFSCSVPYGTVDVTGDDAFWVDDDEGTVHFSKLCEDCQETVEGEAKIECAVSPLEALIRFGKEEVEKQREELLALIGDKE